MPAQPILQVNPSKILWPRSLAHSWLHSETLILNDFIVQITSVRFKDRTVLSHFQNRLTCGCVCGIKHPAQEASPIIRQVITQKYKSLS